MSAYMHEDTTYDRILATITEMNMITRYDPFTPLQLVKALREENYKSVAFRYPSVKQELHEYIPHRGTAYTYIELFKILESVDYQSCEHPGWYESRTYKSMLMVQHVAAGRVLEDMEEYKKASWG